MAAGEVVQEELLPAAAAAGQQQGGAGGSLRHRRSPVCEGEHGRRPVPEEGGPQDVQGLPRAQGGPGGHVHLLLRRRRAGRSQPGGLRRHLRGQGRRPHARRRRALRHVHQHLQEAEDHEGIRGSRARRVSEEQLIDEDVRWNARLSRAPYDDQILFFFCGFSDPSNACMLSPPPSLSLLVYLLSTAARRGETKGCGRDEGEQLCCASRYDTHA